MQCHATCVVFLASVSNLTLYGGIQSESCCNQGEKIGRKTADMGKCCCRLLCHRQGVEPVDDSIHAFVCLVLDA